MYVNLARPSKDFQLYPLATFTGENIWWVWVDSHYSLYSIWQWELCPWPINGFGVMILEFSITHISKVGFWDTNNGSVKPIDGRKRKSVLRILMNGKIYSHSWRLGLPKWNLKVNMSNLCSRHTNMQTSGILRALRHSGNVSTWPIFVLMTQQSNWGYFSLWIAKHREALRVGKPRRIYYHFNRPDHQTWR